MTEITNEQRAAVEWLQRLSAMDNEALAKTHAAAVLAALPSELTNPHPALPTEHGWYQDRLGDVWRFDEGWSLQAGGKWSLDGEAVDEVFARSCAPFTRLVPERPQITREQVNNAIASYDDLIAGDSAFVDWVYAALALGVHL